MLWKIFLALTVTLSTSAGEVFTPSADVYLLSPLIPALSTLNMFDGPSQISQAPTSTITTTPTVTQLMYYNYYAASMYCQYNLRDLNCVFCDKFREDVDAHAVLLNNNTNTAALVTLAHNRREIVVTYRGTAAVWNVVLDSLFINVNFGNIKLHKGYYCATMSLYDEVVKHVTYLRQFYPNYKLVITGHSLGGVMARITLFFLLLNDQYPGCTYEIYTYGEPRGGNKEFVDFMNNQVVKAARVVARGDIFPHVYPVTTFIADNYLQTLTEYFINGLNDQQFCNRSMYEDPNCSNSLGPAYNVFDHILYFEVNYGLCFVQAAQFLAIPGDILQPVGTIPPPWI